MSFEHFDQKIADTMIKANDGSGGLPGFLGVKFVEFGPGPPRRDDGGAPELLTPFGTSTAASWRASSITCSAASSTR